MTDSAKPAPKQQGEHDYSDVPAILSMPEQRHYRDLPIISTQDFDDVGSVRSAMQDLERGYFFTSAQVCDQFNSDDRINGVLQTRTDALISLPLEVTPVSKKLKARKVAERVQAEWPAWFADAEVKKLLRWGLLLRVGVAEIKWDTNTAGAWTPRLKTWDPRHLWFNWLTRSFWLTTLDGQVEVRPGTGQWVLYCPDGYVRGWMQGLVRSLVLLYLARHWAFRDWTRFSEVHGLPIKMLYTPNYATTEDKEDLEDGIRNIGGEGLIRLARDAEGKGFDLDLLEAASSSWDCFEKLIAKCDECIAIDVLGQNLTTSMNKGGSYAAASVHDRIRMDRVEADSRTLGLALQEQVVRPWTLWNFGDADLTPMTLWSTKGVGDRQDLARTLGLVGDAIKKLRDAGLPVNLEEMAKQFRVPLSAIIDTKRKGQIYQYHMEQGVVTINEVRESLGLPPVPGGDELIKKPAAPAPTEAAPPGDGTEKPGDKPEEEPGKKPEDSEDEDTEDEDKPEDEESEDEDTKDDPEETDDDEE